MKNILMLSALVLFYNHAFSQNDTIIQQGKIHYVCSGSFFSKNNLGQTILFRNHEAITELESKFLLPYGVSYHKQAYFHQNENIMMTASMESTPKVSGGGITKRGMYFTCLTADSCSLNPFRVKIDYQEEYKTILGFHCQKAIVIVVYYYTKKQQEFEKRYIVYFTPTIRNVLAPFKGLKGLPLEYQMEDGTEVYNATKIEDVTLPAKISLQSMYPDFRLLDSDSDEVKEGVKIYQDVMKKSLKKN